MVAAGDVAGWPHPRHGEHIRVEHWTNAVEQAACVAHNITHPDEPLPYRPVEYGALTGARPRAAVAYAGADGRLGAALTLNWPRALVTCRRLLAVEADFPQVVAELDLLVTATPTERRS